MRKFTWTNTSDFDYEIEADSVSFEPAHVVFWRYRTKGDAKGTLYVHRAIRNAQVTNLSEAE